MKTLRFVCSSSCSGLNNIITNQQCLDFWQNFFCSPEFPHNLNLNLAALLQLSNIRSNFSTNKCGFRQAIAKLKTLCLPIAISESRKKCFNVSNSSCKPLLSTFLSIYKVSALFASISLVLHDFFGHCNRRKKKLGNFLLHWRPLWIFCDSVELCFFAEWNFKLAREVLEKLGH